MKPKFFHDCDRCKFLGQATYKRFLEEKFVSDLYFCQSVLGGTIISRFGNDGPAYVSCPIKIMTPDMFKGISENTTDGPGLVEAYLKAKDL